MSDERDLATKARANKIISDAVSYIFTTDWPADIVIDAANILWDGHTILDDWERARINGR